MRYCISYQCEWDIGSRRMKWKVITRACECMKDSQAIKNSLKDSLANLDDSFTGPFDSVNYELNR